jgi:hypothetical protein
MSPFSAHPGEVHYFPPQAGLNLPRTWTTLERGSVDRELSIARAFGYGVVRVSRRLTFPTSRLRSLAESFEGKVP